MMTLKGLFFRKTKLLKRAGQLSGTVFQYRQWEDGRCTFPYSTRDVERIFFETPAKLAKNGQVAWDKLCPSSIALVRDALKKSAENLAEFEITFSIRSPQGGTLWVQARAVPERMRDGSTLWNGHMEDITARHEAEDSSNLMLQTLADQKTIADKKEESETLIRLAKTKNIRILVAEDNDVNQRIIQAMLQRLGYDQTDVVSNGEEAVAAAINIAYDVILMDIQMPRMDGLEASRRIHAYTGQPDKPWIIAVTGGLMQEEQLAIEKAGLNGCLAKPLMVKQLEETLDDLPPF